MFEPVQLRTFLAVAQTLSFTQAAVRLGVRQSTVSQQVRKLEAAAGRQLFARDTHSVRLTEYGEAMLGFARTILEANERAAHWFAGTRLRGRLRFGASEDFVLTRLPEVLEDFRREHPEVDLELTVDLSETLQRRLAAGRLDLVLAKRHPDEPHGRLVWRDRLVWIGGERLRLDPHRPLPLIAFPPPAVTRARALEVLERSGRSWRVVCTSGSLNGLVAAARAGLGVMAHTLGMIPPGLMRLPSGPGLPELGGVDVVLLHGTAPDSASRQPAEALAQAVLAAGDRLQT
ncbi:LysR substrate-binding domain-containing protein [Streptomyces sp. URMC 124]|uniref:LysR substrate-binding domain-containing protein n=1 Tax=Streptomyces sp. URMC 124 TaxID=3423405 RepID=UPI003F1AD76B